MKITTILILIVVTVLTSIWPIDNAIAATLVVDANGGGDFRKIQDAIDDAWDFDTIVVQPGIYREHINYHGSMVTITGTDPNDPNVVESTIIDGSGTGSVVMFYNSEGPYSILQGLTIRDGQNGIECKGADTSPLITKCQVVSNNKGIACSLAKPSITDTIVENNKADGISGSYGEISLCRISGNGGAGLSECQGPVRECAISGNISDGIFNHNGAVTNCVVSSNLRNGFYFMNGWSCNITNCTIVGNKADGISFCPWSTVTGFPYYSAKFNITNCIIVLNGNFAIHGVNTTFPSRWEVSVDWNDIWGNTAGDYCGTERYVTRIGATDISEDPLFAKRGFWDTSMVWHEGEYHLKSKTSRWDTRTETWVSDPADSPCLDRGDPASSLGEEPLPNGGRVNMGAYGGTAEASMSGGPKPLCINFPEMDFNKDCKVDFVDLALFTEHWMECNLDPQDACR